MARLVTKNKERLNLALSKATMRRIERVMKGLGASSKTETIRRVFEEYEAQLKEPQPSPSPPKGNKP